MRFVTPVLSPPHRSVAWLTDVLERMVWRRIKARKLEQLIPWSWKPEQLAAVVDA